MPSSPEDKVLELDASELTYEEWFFLWAAFGQKPDASLKAMTEWRTRSMGMSQQQKVVTFRTGLESLLARGFIVQERDKDGRPVTDQQGQPVYVGKGRIVSRLTMAAPVKS